MTVELLKEIVVSIAGQGAANIVDMLYGKKNVNEFLIAKKLNNNVNQTRNILYKLSEQGLVSFIRKKDTKNGGWYTYYWTLDATKSLAYLKNNLVNQIHALEEQLKSRSTITFYYCPSCHLEMNEENALLHNFTCPECGQVLQLKDTSELVENLNKDLIKLKGTLEIVEKELAVLTSKDRVVKMRKASAEKRKKKKERAARRKIKQEEKKKNEKPKKPIKKIKKMAKKKVAKKARKSSPKKGKRKR